MVELGGRPVTQGVDRQSVTLSVPLRLGLHRRPLCLQLQNGLVAYGHSLLGLRRAWLRVSVSGDAELVRPACVPGCRWCPQAVLAETLSTSAGLSFEYWHVDEQDLHL